MPSKVDPAPELQEHPTIAKPGQRLRKPMWKPSNAPPKRLPPPHADISGIEVVTEIFAAWAAEAVKRAKLAKAVKGVEDAKAAVDRASKRLERAESTKADRAVLEISSARAALEKAEAELTAARAALAEAKAKRNSAQKANYTSYDKMLCEVSQQAESLVRALQAVEEAGPVPGTRGTMLENYYYNYNDGAPDPARAPVAPIELFRQRAQSLGDIKRAADLGLKTLQPQKERTPQRGRGREPDHGLRQFLISIWRIYYRCGGALTPQQEKCGRQSRHHQFFLFLRLVYKRWETKLRQRYTWRTVVQAFRRTVKEGRVVAASLEKGLQLHKDGTGFKVTDGSGRLAEGSRPTMTLAETERWVDERAKRNLWAHNL